MRAIHFAIPGDLDTPTGGYRYDRALLKALRECGHDVHHVALPGSFPWPDASDLATTRERLWAIRAEDIVLVDGLAFAVLPTDLLRGIRAKVIALVHHPLSLETGISADAAAALARSERDALTFAQAVVVTSAATKETVTKDFGVPGQAITVATPGLDALWFAVQRKPQSPPLLVSVGSLTRRKGFDVLINALSQLRDRPFSCDIIGSADRDLETASALEALIDATGQAERIRLCGAISEAQIAERYARATLFSLATRYEGFGMVFAEAMAAGLPIVGTRAGAVPDVVPPQAGVLVPPDDPSALARAIATLLDDPKTATDLAQNARWTAEQLGGWDRTAKTVSDVIERLH